MENYFKKINPTKDNAAQQVKLMHGEEVSSQIRLLVLY